MRAARVLHVCACATRVLHVCVHVHVCVCVCACAREVVETDGQKRTWQKTWRTGPAGLLRSGEGVAGTEGTEG